MRRTEIGQNLEETELPLVYLP